MNRKLYLQIPIVLVASTILSIILLIIWALLLVPVMVKPAIIAGLNPVNKITEYVSRRMIQSAMKGYAQK